MKLEQAYRITSFVPPDHLDAVLEAVLEEVPLAYGPYEKSAWWSAVGTEQFEPVAGASPSVGEIGRTEKVPTVRLEFVIPPDKPLLDAVLRALARAHPWQEPAMFVDSTLITLSSQPPGTVS